LSEASIMPQGYFNGKLFPFEQIQENTDELGVEMGARIGADLLLNFFKHQLLAVRAVR
jgi:hypothetical protein